MRTSSCVLLILTMLILGASVDGSHEARIKAAFVSSLLLFTSPQSADESSPGSAPRIAVLGRHDADPDFSSVVGRRIEGQALELVWVDSPDSLPACDLIYVSLSYRDRLEELQQLLDSEDGITASEIEGFCEKGGTVRIYEKRNRLALEISLAAADRQQVRFSAQLLKMARLHEAK